MVFSTPHDEFFISGHDILGEGTWDRYLQAPKMYLVISHTCGQHALTKVVQKVKIHVFKQFWRQKLHKIKLKCWYISIFLFSRFKMKKTSSIWYILIFVSIWNHPEHIIYVFRHFWLYFMLKNVNFGLLDHFGQLVLTTCVRYDQIHFGGL